MESAARRPTLPRTLQREAVVNLRSFFAELKRRNVYKVAIAYGLIAWLLMQIATQVFRFLEIPNWAIRRFLGGFVLDLGDGSVSGPKSHPQTER